MRWRTFSPSRVFYAYSYGSPKLSRFSWRRKTILVAARRETWQFWSRRELHFSLLDERLSILVVTCCYEAPQDLLNSGRQTRQISSYNCVQGQKSFGQAATLKTHMLTHRHTLAQNVKSCLVSHTIWRCKKRAYHLRRVQYFKYFCLWRQWTIFLAFRAYGCWVRLTEIKTSTIFQIFLPVEAMHSYKKCKTRFHSQGMILNGF